MHFSTSIAAFLLALPACLAAPTESQPPQGTHDNPVMVSYTIKDGNGDLYFLCAGSGGNPTAVYRKTGKVEAGCVFKYSSDYLTTTLESTYAKGTYLGRDGTNGLSLGQAEKGDSWGCANLEYLDVNIEGAELTVNCGLAINLSTEATDPKIKDTYYPNPPDATKGDNQKVTLVTKKTFKPSDLPDFARILWGFKDPTAANNTKQ